MSRRTKAHRLVLIDRGEGHIHRWTPTCSCGAFWGQHRRTRNDAATEWRNGHLRFVNNRPQVKRGSRRGTIAGPRPVTPTDQLPEALR